MTTDQMVTLIASLVGGTAGLGALITALSTKRRTNAESTDIITQAAERVVTLTSSDRDKLLAKVEEQDRVIAELQEEIAQLHVEIADMAREKASVEEINERLVTQVAKQNEIIEQQAETIKAQSAMLERQKADYDSLVHTVRVLQETLQAAGIDPPTL